MSSIQSGNIAKISYLPLSEIKRPIPPVLDYSKIDSMVSTLKGIPAVSATCSNIEDITAGELPPIDVMMVRENGKSYYFAFGGCHRFQAYEKAGNPMVKCKIFPATKKQLKIYLGSSIDQYFQQNEN
ncbi:hypothetical protein PACTADRAFT_50691 [Pachysolen tannophilus NRRL Y-2460]|uniref:Sulfiredoxin n=1 Tax=Pachysolen tannophilus NRRL Y-2460 TaxID=669874 RepID=A0A1E4TSV1_PACTA|nr:hypothetical protein PACTADRAFT_50691 [Pachysolen tannophilus NRRL Y-2460]